jgi:spoIIIJ-associated protein
MEDLNQAAQKIADFLKLLTGVGGFRFKFRIIAGPGAADPDGLERRDIYVDLDGPDAPLLTARNAELLHSLEHIAARILRLEQQDFDRISFDSRGFKAIRARELKLTADTAAARVRESGSPFAFNSMNSRERRMLHLALKDFEDLRTESDGEGFERHVVLYPKDWSAATDPRAAAIRKTFSRK